MAGTHSMPLVQAPLQVVTDDRPVPPPDDHNRAADAFAYDRVDYPGCVRPQSHPSRLAAIARLHGVAAASPAQCRLLEVGCGDGANLLPLALAYPHSRFVGVDLSATALARGERLRARLGLSNLQLQLADLGSWDPGAAPFDYVIAHGFYSWVPAPVRDALLALCRDRLTPHGVAYVSYNALPGCHLRRMVWEMLRFHVRDIGDPEQKLAQALDFLKFLEQGVLSQKAYSSVVREEARQLLQATDPAVLFHDDLADLNEPVSITDFVGHARRFDLEFLGEADYYEMSEEAAPPAVAEHLRGLAASDTVLKEQTLDFLKGRRFRETLLCAAAAPLQRTMDAAAVPDFDVVGQITTDPDTADFSSRIKVQFRDPLGAALSTDHPVAKAVLAHIGAAFPAPLSATALLAAARERVGHDSAEDLEADRAAVTRTLLLAFRLGLITFLCDAPRFATLAGERPQVSALALAELELGRDRVTSLRPSVIRLENPLTRELVRLLDGSRDRPKLLDDLATRMAADTALIPPGEPARPLAWWREQLAPQIDTGLAQAAQLALLVEQ